MLSSKGKWTVVLLLLAATIIVAEEVPDSAEYYYFIKEYPPPEEQQNEFDTIAEIIEICTTDDSISTPSGFTQVSLTWLHNNDYKSCSEAEEDAAQNNDIDEDLTDGYYKSSWLNRTYYYAVIQWKRVYCGSSTTRSWSMPGPCYCRTETRYRPELLLANKWPYYQFWGYAWGWRKSHSYVCQYPATSSILWRQIGNHKWNSNPSYTTTLIERTW